MAILTWDGTGERKYETGVDHGVLYPLDGSAGDYPNGVAWNGLTAVTETPTGAESNPQYADNIVYVDLYSAERFGGTIEAFTYPDEFAACDGTAEPEPGVYVGGQTRQQFGLCYRTLVGNDVAGSDLGYKLHLVWGAKASPSEKANATVNESPELLALSWEFTTTPVPVTGLKPSSIMIIDSTKVDSDALAALELILFGDSGVDPRLPLPAEVLSIFAGAVTAVNMVGANAPTYVSGTHIVTLPSVAGVTWKINGIVKTAGAQPAMTVGQVSVITAHPNTGYYLTGDDDWVYNY